MWRESLSILICFVVFTILGGFALAGDRFVDFEGFALMANQQPNTHPYIPNDMAYIPDGKFDMGDHYDVGNSNEKPVHTVYVDSFFMSKYEITNQQYCDFLNSADVNVVRGVVYASSDSRNDYPYFDTYSADSDSQITYSEYTFSVRTRDTNDMNDHPVVEVSWYGAAAYCNWRSQQEGYQACYDLSNWKRDFSKNGYRLPTEGEWEYAARGDCHEPYYKYPWCSNSIDCNKANCGPDTYCNPLELSDTPYTSPVGYYSANNYGLFDMAGNVKEWCNDWYDADYYDASPYGNPTGPDSSTYRVLRGGWLNYDYARLSSFEPPQGEPEQSEQQLWVSCCPGLKFTLLLLFVSEQTHHAPTAWPR